MASAEQDAPTNVGAMMSGSSVWLVRTTVGSPTCSGMREKFHLIPGVDGRECGNVKRMLSCSFMTRAIALLAERSSSLNGGRFFRSDEGSEIRDLLFRLYMQLHS